MTTLPSRRATPRRRDAPEESTEWWVQATHALAVRSTGRTGGPQCERCGRPLTAGVRAERHHRQRRRDGGDRLANLLLLCNSAPARCHQHVTEHPREAVANGWIVPATGDADPATVPVRLADGYLYLLDDLGGRTLIP